MIQMSEPINKTAVLYFSLSPSVEVHNKILSSSRGQNKNILESLFNFTKSKLGNVTLDVIHWDEGKQEGDSFGDRFSHAFRSLFDLGYENIVAIGNDCPELNVGDITSAANSLKRNFPVIGPSNDGGVYLLAISKSHFNSLKFKNISWNSSKVAGELKRLFPRVKSLPEKSDIDNASNFYDFIKHHRGLKIFKWLKSIVSPVLDFIDLRIFIPERLFVLRSCQLPPPSI